MYLAFALNKSFLTEVRKASFNQWRILGIIYTLKVSFSGFKLFVRAGVIKADKSS